MAANGLVAVGVLPTVIKGNVEGGLEDAAHNCIPFSLSICVGGGLYKFSLTQYWLVEV